MLHQDHVFLCTLRVHKQKGSQVGVDIKQNIGEKSKKIRNANQWNQMRLAIK